MLKIITEAIINCPNCGSKYQLKMPKTGKHINSKCVCCHTLFGIQNIKDCCVYCIYSDVKCPKAQIQLKKNICK
ncbi:GDCCVxC domain-containing (seleno)protein [Formosa sp. PL04]|uniref:GDCCVxC domain-containing (seleno)protein n=1 Tax=Formosa sp. PL04 TaxID=3081755 RepID=UPI003995F739